MKKLSLFVLLCFPTFVFSQTVYESLHSLNKTYHPLFGKETSRLSIDLIKQYDLTGSDTTYHVMVQVNQKTTEQVGHSFGISLFGSGLTSGQAVSGAASYVYNKENGVILMGFTELEELYQAFNKTYQYISTRENIKSAKRGSLVTYKARDIVFGGEYDPSAVTNKATYYIQVGGAIFTMDNFNFRDIGTTIRNIKQSWELSQ